MTPEPSVQSELTGKHLNTINECLQLQELMAGMSGVFYQYILAADGSEKYTYIIGNFLDVYGVELDDFTIDSDHIFGLKKKGDRQNFYKSIYDCAAHLKSWSRQWQYTTPNGEVKWLYSSAKPERQPNHDLVLNGFIFDTEMPGDYHGLNKPTKLPAIITSKFTHLWNFRQYRLLASLQKRLTEWWHHRNQIDRLFNHTVDLVVILNLDGNFKFLNSAWTISLGYDFNELINSSFMSLVYQSDQTITFYEFNAIHYGKNRQFENRLLSKDGSYKWWSWTFVPVFESGAIYGVGRDITEPKAIADNLKAVEDKFRRIIDFTYDWEYWINPQQEIVYISPSCERITGYSVKEFMQDHSLLEKIVLPEDRDRIVPHLYQNLCESNNQEIDFRIITRDQQVRWIGHNYQPIYDAAGQYQGKRVSNRDITQRKQKETEALRVAENLEMAQRIAHVGNWEYDVVTQKITCSDELLQILGWVKEQDFLTFEELRKLIHPDDRDNWLNQVERALATGKSYEIDHRIVRPNGEIRYIQGRGEVVRNQVGQVLRLFEITMDITDRKQSEQILRDREQFLSSIYDGIEQAIFVVDVTADGDFQFVGWNPASEKITGIKSVDIIGKKPEEMFLYEYATSIRRHYENCWLKKSSLQYEEYLNFGQNQIFSLTTLNPIIDDSGRVTRIIGTAFDISNLKETEENLRLSEAQLRELAEREALENCLSSLIRNSLDTDTILATAVAEIRRVLDIDRTYFVWYRSDLDTPEWEVKKEAKIDSLSSISEIYPGDALRPVSKYILAGEMMRIDDIATCPTPTIRNFFLVLECRSVLILPIQTQQDTKGALVLAHCQDIHYWTHSEVALLEAIANQLVIALNQAELYATTQEAARMAQAQTETLEATLNQLQQAQVQLVQSEKMSSLGQMVAGLAHEINNPVSFIYGNITHAKEYARDLLGVIELYQKHYPQAHPEITEEIEAIDLEFLIEDLPRLFQSMTLGADRIRDIIKSLRTFARLDESEVKYINLHENIDSTLMILDNRRKEKPNHPAIQVYKQYGDIPQIECYAGQLNQVFLNLINNAIDAICDRYKKQTLQQIINDPGMIWISTMLTEEKTVQIRIADNGIGISPDIISKVFDPFYTTKPVGSGTGLGLSTSYQIIVEKHGGTLRCVSQESVGSEFVMEIPLKLPQKSSLTQSQPPSGKINPLGG
ncbi:MAG: PAS domain S-box protein [Arthrospira sp. PLM2.Bin9]|nr:PAS domain-containing protein [Arthrospira sp. PLM2.Bin9]TVU52277.1 MAG: PAS domain S-box protein [Arthrospira sp. PLM2.Bin9]